MEASEITIPIYQVSHGFTNSDVNKALTYSFDTGYSLFSGTGEVVGILKTVVDIDNFVTTRTGLYSISISNPNNKTRIYAQDDGTLGFTETEYFVGFYTTDGVVLEIYDRIDKFPKVKTISDLENYAAPAETIYLAASGIEGLFQHINEALTADGGTIFTATGKGSGVWK